MAFSLDFFVMAANCFRMADSVFQDSSGHKVYSRSNKRPDG